MNFFAARWIPGIESSSGFWSQRPCHPSEPCQFQRIHQSQRRPSALVKYVLLYLNNLRFFSGCHDVMIESFAIRLQPWKAAVMKSIEKPKDKKVRRSRKAGTNMGFCWKHLCNQLVTSHGLKPCWGSCTIFGSSEGTSCLRDLHAREVSVRQRQKPTWQCEWNEENRERAFGGQVNFFKVTFPRFEVLKFEL